MAEGTHVTSPKSDPIEAEGSKEDADTAAARKELKQTVISDNAPVLEAGASGCATETTDKAAQASTPDSDSLEFQEEDLKEQVSSPKKKRAHAEVDPGREVEEADARSVASSDSAKHRGQRSEPEKKRHRDEVTESVQSTDESVPTISVGKDNELVVSSLKATAEKSDIAPKDVVSISTSPSAFAASGFAKLASSSTSPFGSLAGTAPKGSVFGSVASAPSPFASLSASQPAPLAAAPVLSFKSTNATAGASPFGSITATGANGGFSSTFGGGFASGMSGKPLGSFAQPGGSFKSEKPAKPFGAPDSDAEDESDEGDGDGEDDSSSEGAEKEDSDRDDPKTVDDKKKAKLQKIVVNDGEAGEVTILAVRAKMFYLEKEVGWKERGAGMLKINVPESCIQFDEAGVPIPGSFDASAMQDEDDDGTNEETGLSSGGHKVARLILRQDHTHRVLLNTAILPAMKFQEKASLKAVGVMFTAFQGEDAKPISVHMRMSAASAKSFTSEIGMIQRELQSSS